MKQNDSKIFFTTTVEEGKSWQDPEFPPSINSLCNKSTPKALASTMKKDIEWKRATQIWDSPKMFANGLAGLSPNDVEQGLLGNCYFLAVLSSLASFPDRI